MKKIITIVVCVLMFIGGVSVEAVGSIDFEPTIHKAVYKLGEKIKMKWSAEDLDPNLTLSIYIQSIQNGFLYPIKSGAPQVGKFTWKIPKDTASSSDYMLSMSTDDKGPSVSSDNSAKFAIQNKTNKAEFIKKFDLKVDSKKIDVKMQRKNGERMGLNIACKDTEVRLSMKGASIPCNSWYYFTKTNDNMKLEYKNLTDGEVTVYFTLDLYEEGSTLLQRVFKDVTLENKN